MNPRGVYLALHQVVGLVFQVGDTEKVPQALGVERLDPFFFLSLSLRVSKQGLCLTAIEEYGSDKRLLQLELVCGCWWIYSARSCLIRPLLLFAEAILVWISAEQVPSVQRVAPRYLKLRAGHTNIFTDVAHAVGHELALFCPDFHSIHPFSVYESVAEVLKFVTAAAQKIDVVGES